MKNNKNKDIEAEGREAEEKNKNTSKKINKKNQKIDAKKVDKNSQKVDTDAKDKNSEKVDTDAKDKASQKVDTDAKEKNSQKVCDTDTNIESMEDDKWKKIKLIFGYVLMMIGISLPLIPLTNVCISNLKEEQAYKSFTKIERKYNEKEIASYNENVIKNQDSGIIDPFKNEDYKAEYDFMKKDPNGVFAFIQIPKLKINLPIRLGASYDNLNKGAAQIDNTSLPVGGIGNRSVIAGHRGWYNGNMFLHINRLEKGDDVIIIDSDHSKLRYKVEKKYIIQPNDWEALKPVPDQDILTLLTCDPVITTNPKRLVIDCVREDGTDDTSDHSTRASSTSSHHTSTSSHIAQGQKEDYHVLLINIIVHLLTAFGWFVEIVILYKILKQIRS